MSTITIEELQRDVVGHLHRVARGETLIVLDADRPLAEIKPVAPTLRERRPYGLCAGHFVTPADFDAPLPEEIVRAFEGR